LVWFAHFSNPADGGIKESLMQSIQVDHAGASRLRFVFDDGVVSLSLAAHATFEDIARTLGKLAQQHHSDPLAIDVTFAGPSKSCVSPRVA
jgi:hypothetical protein